MRRFGTGWWDRHYRLVSRLLLAGIILLLLHAIQLKLTPAFHGAAQIAAQNLATELVNEQVVEILQDYDGDFATIERAEDGRVLSVGLDAVKANLLKAELSQKLTKELDNLAARPTPLRRWILSSTFWPRASIRPSIRCSCGCRWS